MIHGFCLHLFLLVTLSFVSLSAQASLTRNHCNTIFDPHAFLSSGFTQDVMTDAEGVKLFRRIDDTEYKIKETGTDFDFQFWAFIKGEVFSVVVETRNDSGKRSKYIYAAKELDASLKHFGEKIKVFKGKWLPSSDNHKQFQKALRNGESKEDAAFSTWTGQQAKKHGFTEIKSLQIVPLLNGEEHIFIEFVRPTP